MGPMVATEPTLSERFAHFADVEIRGYSPLYESLSRLVAADRDLLELAAETTPGQPAPNLLFAAVRYVLFAEPADPLAKVYAAAGTGGVLDLDRARAEFRRFALAHGDRVADLVRTRRVQTNEVGRSSFLRPAIARAAEGLGAGELALVELGSSAGLNLVLDAYAVRYRQGDRVLRAGPPDAALTLDCELRGQGVPPTGFPRVLSRVGIDANPVDLRDPAAVLWLRALVWPDHATRERLLADATRVGRELVPPLRRGDAAELLPRVLDEVPAGLPVCVYHSAFWYQLPDATARAIEATLEEAARARPLAHVSVTSPDRSSFELRSTAVGRGPPRLVGRAHAHGLWLEYGAGAIPD